MKYSHVFLDFDETLFDHYSYADWADSVLAKKFSKPRGFFRDSFDEFHDYLDDPLLRLFRHSDHMKSTTGRSWEYVSAELEKEQRLRKKDFCYPDTHELLEWLVKQPYDVRILTFGEGDYQRYKINSCSLIKRLHIPVHVVKELKRSFLEREFTDIKRGILVDDKHPLKLPHLWDEAWINRSEKLASPKLIDQKTYQISDLKQVRTYLN